MATRYERLRAQEAEEAMEVESALTDIERVCRDAREAIHRWQALHARLGLIVVVRNVEPRRPAA